MCTAPLSVTSTASYLTLALSTTAAYTMGSLTCTGLATVGSIQCNGDATITGNLTVNANLNPDALIWVSGKISGTGLTLTSGGITFTSSRSTGNAAGVYRITFSQSHPLGNGNYTVFVSAQGGYVYVRTVTAPPTSSYFEIVSYTTAGVLLDAPISFMVMNW